MSFLYLRLRNDGSEIPEDLQKAAFRLKREIARAAPLRLSQIEAVEAVSREPPGSKVGEVDPEKRKSARKIAAREPSEIGRR
jgi:hypothetical protein